MLRHTWKKHLVFFPGDALESETITHTYVHNIASLCHGFQMPNTFICDYSIAKMQRTFHPCWLRQHYKTTCWTDLESLWLARYTDTLLQICDQALKPRQTHSTRPIKNILYLIIFFSKAVTQYLFFLPFFWYFWFWEFFYQFPLKKPIKMLMSP